MKTKEPCVILGNRIFGVLENALGLVGGEFL